MLELTLSPKFQSVCSLVSRFQVTGHFETSAPNNLKMTLNTKRPKVIVTTTRVPTFQPNLFYGQPFLSYNI